MPETIASKYEFRSNPKTITKWKLAEIIEDELQGLADLVVDSQNVDPLSPETMFYELIAIKKRIITDLTLLVDP